MLEIVGTVITWVIVIGLAWIALMFIGAALGAVIGNVMVFFRDMFRRGRL